MELGCACASSNLFAKIDDQPKACTTFCAMQKQLCLSVLCLPLIPFVVICLHEGIQNGFMVEKRAIKRRMKDAA